MTIGIIAGVSIYKEWIPNDLYLPTFSISAEEIFANDIALFDVNFFQPEKYTKQGEKITTYEQETIFTDTIALDYYPDWIYFYQIACENEFRTLYYNDMEGAYESAYIREFQSESELKNFDWNYYASEYRDMADYRQNKALIYIVEQINKAQQEDNLYILAEVVNGSSGKNIKVESGQYEIIGKGYYEKDDYGIPIRFIKHMKIQSEGKTLYTIEYSHPPVDDNKSQISATIKIIREKVTGTTMQEVEIESTAAQLSVTISKWYFILRNLALLVLMLLLIYSGIRIVIGSTAGEKAKYKERIMDWLVAMCLIFIMHYIMAFAVQLVEKITDLVRDISGLNGNAAYIELTDEQYKSAKKIIDSDQYDIKNIGEILDYNGDGVFELSWKTDLAGLFRIQSQLTGEGTAKWAGYALCYVVLVLYTLFFAWTYVKRVLYMAFLTMIAPLVAMTYPIDKITDGKAQAFDAWLKEYIFNLMIQPLHLLLYAMLVSSAFELATSSPIYALVAIGFMMPAEKLMRRFFGFEKARTPGLLGGAAGAAIAMTGLQNLMKHKPHGGKNESGSAKSNEQNKVKFVNKNSIDTMGAVAGEGATQGTLPRAQSTSENDSLQGSNNDSEGNSTLRQQTNSQPIGNNNIDSSSGDMDEDDILFNTTLGSEDWDHDGFGTSSTGESSSPNDYQQQDGASVDIDPISTFEQTKAARAAYNRPQFRSFEEERAANIAREREERKKRIKGATGAVLSTAGRQLAASAIRGFHPLKLAGKIATGATAGTAGLLLGVASGDPNKVFQYTTAGAMAGSALAGSFSGSQILDAQQLKKEAEIGYYGSEYKQKVIDDQKKAFQKDYSNINYLRQTMGIGKEEAKYILSTTGGECFDNGITSIEDIATIHKLTKGEDHMSFKQAVAARNYAKKRLPSDPDQMTQKSIESYINRWTQEYHDAGYANASTLAQKSFDMAIKFNKAQSSLTKNP